MPANYFLDPGPEFFGNATAVALSPGDSGLARRAGKIGGALLSEIRQRMNGAGVSLTIIPAGFDWEMTNGGNPGTIDNTALFEVVIVDKNSWATVAAIKLEIDP